MACNLTKNDVVFLRGKILSKKVPGFFDHRNYIEKSTWKQCGFFDHQNYAEKSTWKRRGLKIVRGSDMGFFDQRNNIEKVIGNC